MSVRVVDASLVKDKTPQSDRFLKNTYQATIAPGLPPLIFTTDYINDSRMFPKNYVPNAEELLADRGFMVQPAIPPLPEMTMSL